MTPDDEAAAPASTSPAPAARGRILVIEPDADLARMLEVRLARDGYEVLTAETSLGGQHLADQHSVDVVLVDRDLADASNLELLRALRSTPNPCEIIIMTVDPTVDIFVDALDKGAFDLVVKPFSNLTLVTSKVRNASAKVRAERERDELRARLERLQVETPVVAEPGDIAGADAAPSGLDAVTGLPGIAAAERRFHQETSRALRYDRPLTVVFISVDKLEAIVEVAGAARVDAVLRELARLLEGQIRDVDFLARRSGGEFMLLLPETAKADAAVVAERIRTLLEGASFEGGSGEGAIRLTASFGVAGLPTDTMNADLLRQSGQVALVRAEASGNTVVLYEPAPGR